VSFNVTRDVVWLQDVFILDTCRSCFVWVGSGASPNEKKNGFGYAHVRDVSTRIPSQRRVANSRKLYIAKSRLGVA